MNTVVLRDIAPEDNKILASIIKASLAEFNAAKPGTVYFDESTDCLAEVFNETGSKYFVATLAGEIIGGAGIYPTRNLPEGTCELVKVYLRPNARGQGVGKLLLAKCEEAARELGYKKIYLETMPELKVAVPMYERMGFQYLPAAMGESGHTGCDIWMLKQLAT
ncbi:MAG: GNAT family N-acetyltransferase [Ferruginibacter sp.]